MKNFLTRFVVVLSFLLATANVSAEVNDGTYSIKASHSDKCLDVSGAGNADGENVMQYDCHEGDNQHWLVKRQTDKHFQIQASHSVKCLDISVHKDRPNDGADTGNFANVIQWDCHGGEMQHWELLPVDGKANTFSVKSAYTGKCLDVSGNSTNNSANVHKYDCHTGSNQQFTFVQKAKSGAPVAATELMISDKYVGLWKHQDDYNGKSVTLVLSIADQGHDQMKAEYLGRPYFSYRPLFDSAGATPEQFEAEFKLVLWDDSTDVSSYTIGYTLARSGEVLEGTYAPSWKAAQQVTLVRATEKDIP